MISRSQQYTCTMDQPLNDISNKDTSNRGSNVFKRLSTSPMRKPGLSVIDKPAVRLSPTKSSYQTSPKRLIPPEHLSNVTRSVDRHHFIKRPEHTSSLIQSLHGGADIVIPISPIKMESEKFGSVTTVGGDGSLSRIKNRFSPSKDRKSIMTVNEETLSPTRQNLLNKLQRDEDLSKVTKKNTKLNSELISNFKVGKSQITTRSKNVKFELPEDRMIAIELQNLKQLLQMLLERQDRLELKIAELESKTE
ncbi:Fin1p Ecym_4271 [Eremothecium cymbalariae DBVPG|uniref:Uncharacterized protein n=1 Tax=Eremothecium cymbalariae (strain CBS 270.75 / DBVPG 7215 / KCTC 17166 / NRRL Y-17582) TaxID=931890 RepID=G8JTI2_ERECY|nr:hypothetical protein Ecym_4271 [Eremothecium cymbalariae DBVPG\